ncbi:MAG: hypothetical protein KJ058_17920, partial [Thermoanaerobaculia bacterium]|nr:hypothetical protein [Thermoanaerobaculia bacterium]
MSPRFLLRQLAREMRGAGGRIAFFTLSLAVGVASVVGVASLSAGIDGALRREARQLLAGD